MINIYGAKNRLSLIMSYRRVMPLKNADTEEFDLIFVIKSRLVKKQNVLHYNKAA